MKGPRTARKQKAYATVDRMLEVVALLQRSKSGMTTNEILEELGFTVSRRTLYRYLERISTQYPVYSEMDDTGMKRWRIMDTAPTVGLNFSSEELYALKVAQKLITSQFRGSEMEKWFESLYGKIDCRLNPRIRNNLEQLGSYLSAFFPGVKDYSKSSGYFFTLLDSIIWLRRIHLKYRPVGSRYVEQYTVEPYCLVNAKGGFYLVGRVLEVNDIRTFAIERIHKIKQEGKTHAYDIPEDFSPSKYFDGAFGIVPSEPTTVKIQFDSKLKEYLSERYWPGFEKLEQSDGSLIITLKIGITRELISWILSFGAHAKVLEPEVLRNKVIEDLKNTLKMYE